MKISIRLCIGNARIYHFDVEPSISIEQLKKVLFEETGNKQGLKTIWLVYKDVRLDGDDDDDETTLKNYDIPDESILEAIKANSRSLMGIKLADLNNGKGLKKQKWSINAPSWRRAAPGLCLEGICNNSKCEANKQRVVISMGYRKFNMLLDADATTTMCPICKKFVDPETCGFNNCWWRFEGMKQEKAGEPPVKCSNDWQYVGNSYHYFDQETSGTVTWKQLIIEAVEKEPSM